MMQGLTTRSYPSRLEIRLLVSDLNTSDGSGGGGEILPRSVTGNESGRSD